jgi:hypothetical protein
MPKRDDPNVSYLNLNRLRRRMQENENSEWYKSLTGRDLYEMDTINLMNKTVIDRPITLSLNNVEVTLTSGSGTAKDDDKEIVKSIDPESIMTDCMIDGRVVIRIQDSWDNLEVEPWDQIHTVETDGTGYISYLRIQYQIEVENNRQGGWFRRDYRKIEFIDFDTGRRDIVYVRIDFPIVKRPEDFEKVDPNEIIVTEIPYIPFVAMTWNKAQVDFLITAKRAFIELERVSIEISGENNKHSRRKLFIKAPAHTEKEVAELGNQINQLTPEGDAFYPDPHAAVINGFFKEKDDAIEAIENKTGVVATEKIVALSGVSRITAMKSLIDLSQKIRKKFIALMVLIEELFKEHDIDNRQMTVFVPPLGMLIVDVNNQDALLTVAHEDGDITDYEKREIRRQMLSL